MIVVLALSGCIPYIDNLYDSDKISTFNYLCDQIENHYVYLDYKGLDFQNIKNVYQPQVNNAMSDEDYFHVLEGFVNELEDRHSNIFAPFTYSSAYLDITNGYAANYDAQVIADHYLNIHPVYKNSFRNGLIDIGGVLYGYIYYASFSNSISTYEMEYVLNRFRTNAVKGIILDIRDNGGGSMANAITLLSYFGGVAPGTATVVLKGWRRDSKTVYTEIDGFDHAPMYKSSFSITTNDKVYRGPVALLTNRLSYSASSFTSTAFKAYANVKQIGGITGGGMGLPIGGTMPNGWTYRFSGNVVLDARATSYLDNAYNYEAGVPADITIDDDPATTDHDEIIDAALTWINSAEAVAFVDL